MPVARLADSDTPDVMETDDNNDSIVTEQAVENESFLSLPVDAVESALQWVQLLQALDRPVPGWPLISPVKIQLQKCDKCSREFCSPINYRRHVRVHHRMKNLDKDTQKNRELLGAYWDKLSVEEAMEVVSFKNVILEAMIERDENGDSLVTSLSHPQLRILTLIKAKEVPGSSILNALTILIHNELFSPLPYYYLRAGAALLDIVESNPSGFPLSSQDLFSVLDDSSEKTFLCGSAESMQRYVFDGEAGKIGLEARNLVACTAFLLEQKMVKAWLADQDAEALRCQNLLLEEEEAARRRQAGILEKKRKKKLKQKEQKARERLEDDKKIEENSAIEAATPAEASLVTHVVEAHNPDTIVNHSPSPHVTFHFPVTSQGASEDPQSGNDEEIEENSAVEAVTPAEASLGTHDFEVHVVNHSPSPHVTFHFPVTSQGEIGDPQSGNDKEIEENCAVQAVTPAEASLGTHDSEAHNPDTIVNHSPSPHATFHFPVTGQGANEDPHSHDKEIEENSALEAVMPAEASLGTHDFEARNPDTVVNHSPSPHVTFHSPVTSQGANGDPQSRNDCDTDQNIEQQMSGGHNRQRMIAARQHGLPKSQRAVASGSQSHASQNSQLSKQGAIQKCGIRYDQRAAPVNDSEVWSQKHKPETDGGVLKARMQKEPDQGKNHEVLIGSIPVTLGKCSQSEESNLEASRGDCMVENLVKQNTAQEKPMKTESFQSGNSRSTVKLGRPVSQHGTKDPLPLQSGVTEADAVLGKDDQHLSGQSSLRPCNIDDSNIGYENNFSFLGAKVDPGILKFSRHAAKAFLAQRWKEAISSDHVKLVVSLDSEPPGCQEVQDNELATPQASDVGGRSIVASAENQLPATPGVTKSKPRLKAGKGSKKKHIPKQKADT